MQPSLRALMSGIIDYAGLFPPAKLPMDPAIRNYARFRKEPEGWMLGRFICPASRLAELAPYHELFADKPPFQFSVLGRGGADAKAFIAGVTEDLADVAAFRKRHTERVVAEVYEVKLPMTVIHTGDAAALRGMLDETVATIDAEGPPTFAPWYELDFSGDWRRSFSMVASVLAAHSRENSRRVRYRPAGLKLRCGGLEPAAFPSCEQIAEVINACREFSVPLKCTAGLHHPIRHYNDTVKTKMHGFLNVFGAGLLAVVKRLPQAKLREMLEDENPKHFTLDNHGFAWTDYKLTPPEIASARQQITSFGSCSFDEPRDDLKALGML